MIDRTIGKPGPFDCRCDDYGSPHPACWQHARRYAAIRNELLRLAAEDRHGSPPDKYRARARGRLRDNRLAYATRPPAVLWHVTPEGRALAEAIGYVESWHDPG